MVDRAAMRQQLLNRTKEQFTKKDDQGGFKNIFRPDLDLVIFRCGEGKHFGDIIPFIAGENNPNIAAGSWTYCLDLWVHYKVGPGDDAFVCLFKNWKQPCPACNDLKIQAESGTMTEEEIKDRKAKRRTIYNWWSHDTKDEEAKGVQLWDIAHFFMESKLLQLAEDPETGGLIPYADPDEGRKIYFQRKGKGAGNVEMTAHQFLQRNYKIPDNILEQAYVLDDIIYIPTYDEFHNAYFMGSEKDSGKSDNTYVEEPPHTQQQQSSRLRGRTTQSTTTKSPPKEDEPPKEPTVEPQSSRRQRLRQDVDIILCPAGGTLGVDIDKFELCTTCEEALFKKCDEEAQKIEEKRKAEAAASGGLRRGIRR